MLITGPDTPVLFTRRLKLRPAADTDVPEMVRLAGDKKVATRTAHIPYPYSLEAGEAWFAARQAEHDTGYEMLFAVERRADAALLGAVGLIVDSANGEAEVGYWLGVPYWREGFMSEALGEALRYAFEDIGLAAVSGGAFPDNAASLALQRKLGMTEAGRKIHPAPARGAPRDVLIMKITREEWENRTGNRESL
ncbi:MAG: GNAT family N-acetyltransferase [Rhodospirillales bacterium]